MSQDIALYIHIPFCQRKCRYCSFVSYEKREFDIPLYIDSLKKELTKRISGKKLKTIFFGGGTPSLLSINQVEDIINHVGCIANLDKQAEITFEANPGTVEKTYLAELRKIGINRLSLGVQSLNDAELALLGRLHNAEQARETFHFAQDSGFTNINIDLIFGLPRQELSEWDYTLACAISLKPEHISLYALTLEEDTPMQKDIENGVLPGINNDLSAEEYELAEERLSAAGYRHYELSNWALPGMECQHNLVYWHNLPYAGAGVAAHSCMNGHRFANTNDLDIYLGKSIGEKENLPQDFNEQISPELHLAETIILGLRLDEGISFHEVHQRLGIDLKAKYEKQLTEMKDYGLLETTTEKVKLTRRGRLLGNEVFWRFLPDC